MAYLPEPELEERLAALCFLFESLTLKELKAYFRDAFPGVPLRESWVLMALSLEPRIEMRDDGRYTFVREKVLWEPSRLEPSTSSGTWSNHPSRLVWRWIEIRVYDNSIEATTVYG